MSEKPRALLKHTAKTSTSAIMRSITLSLTRLTPRYLYRNPAIFVTYIGCILITLCTVYGVVTQQWLESPLFMIQLTIWLWFTVIFSNFSEALAEQKSKAHAQSLKSTRDETQAKLLQHADDKEYALVNAPELRKGCLVMVEAGDVIPADGQVISGVAAIDESPITGESAPVIRDTSDDRNSVTGGTQVISDWVIVQIAANPGESFLDKMIALVEGAKRQKTPNEIALGIILAAMTLIFLVVIYVIPAFTNNRLPLTQLIAFIICLIPTTIGGLLSAIGIAGINRLLGYNVIANSGRAVEAAGDLSILLLDKTGTITMGNRAAVAFYPSKFTDMPTLASMAALSSCGDDTPEGRSIVALAKTMVKNYQDITPSDAMTVIPFSADTRMSGVDYQGQQIRKGSVDKIIAYIQENHGEMDPDLIAKSDEIARKGATPLLVASAGKLLGAVELKDIVKPNIKTRLAELRLMGIKSVMVTGDNPLTAATIAAEAGVDDFCAQATPEMKLKLIRKHQNNGQLVGMVGDGTNDAPALAQTDVALAMNSGTQAAKEAANMIDLDSDPTKLIEIVRVGKEFLMTRGALTTFSITNDVAKYFTLIPCAFSVLIPQLNIFNIMHLQSPQSAVLSTVIFNALIIIALIPLALRGVNFKPLSMNQLLLRNTLIYGLGGLVTPFIAIKLIDLVVNMLGAI